jgi:hypothetical protein
VLRTKAINTSDTSVGFYETARFNVVQHSYLLPYLYPPSLAVHHLPLFISFFLSSLYYFLYSFLMSVPVFPPYPFFISLVHVSLSLSSCPTLCYVSAHPSVLPSSYFVHLSYYSFFICLFRLLFFTFLHLFSPSLISLSSLFLFI